MIKILIFILVIFLLFINCSENDPIKSDPPYKVILVQKEEGFDTLEVERGIDAGPNPNSDVNSIQLVWFEPEDKNTLAYYKIYRSVHEEGRIYYNLLGTTENQINALDTVFTDSTQNLSTYRRYWYYVTAVTEDGLEGESSDTVHYKLIDKAYGLSINNFSPVLRDSNITFRWSMNSYMPDYYYLRVEHVITDSFHPLVYIKEIKGNYNETETYDVLIKSFKIQMEEGGEYRWRIDCLGTDLYSGSESNWAIFTVYLE